MYNYCICQDKIAKKPFTVKYMYTDENHLNKYNMLCVIYVVIFLSDDISPSRPNMLNIVTLYSIMK